MPTEPALVSMRMAGQADASRIADLHARSWRAAYRGMLADAYLDGPIAAERRAFWAERFAAPPPGLVTLVAEAPDGTLVGFVCALLDHEPRWGTLVDNLHADPAAKGRGIGRLMLQRLAAHLEAARSRQPVHLFVLRDNRAAAGFYAHLGGESVEAMVKTEPDGSHLDVARIAWPSATAFAAAVSRSELP